MQTQHEQVQVQIDVDQTKAALRGSPGNRKFFIEFFLGAELTLPIPDFHVDAFDIMVDDDPGNDQVAIAIPREHAKTTLAKLACVHYILFSEFTFIAYLSNTIAVAVPAVNDVIGFLESENCISIFGAIDWITRRDGEGYYVFRIPSLGKLIRLKAYGAGQQIRGVNVRHRRPQLAIVDDVETADGDVAKQIPYEMLKKWFYGTFKKALDHLKHKIVQIGNLVSQDSLLNLHCESKYWVSRRYGAILANGNPLWPDKWPIEALQRDFQEYLEAGEIETWFAEMMNIPMPKGGGLIQASEITYAPIRLPEEAQFGFLTIDLAISEQTWAHKTVITVHGYFEEVQQWQTVDHRSFTGIDPVTLFWQVLDLCLHWRFWTVGIESVAYQASLQYVFRYLALEAGLLEDEITFIPCPAHQRKVERLSAWSAMIKAGLWALNRNDFAFTHQLLRYDPMLGKRNKDDVIDSAAHGVYMIKYHYADIMKQKQPAGSVGRAAIPLTAFAAV